jgi:antitoxin ParD1/3/4
MEIINIAIPETLKHYVEERVSERGYGDTSDYIQDLIRHDREERNREAREKLEALLLEGLNSIECGEAIDATPEYWQDRRKRLTAQIEAELQGQLTGLTEPERL